MAAALTALQLMLLVHGPGLEGMCIAWPVFCPLNWLLRQGFYITEQPVPLPMFKYSSAISPDSLKWKGEPACPLLPMAKSMFLTQSLEKVTFWTLMAQRFYKGFSYWLLQAFFFFLSCPLVHGIFCFGLSVCQKSYSKLIGVAHGLMLYPWQA